MEYYVIIYFLTENVVNVKEMVITPFKPNFCALDNDI